MNMLLVLRHAKSSWIHSELTDHERPLNQRGLRAASRMGQLIADENIVPDVILSSTARRARQTAELVAKHCGFETEIAFVDSLYHAGPTAYVDRLAYLDDSISSAMVVGHNPGLENLVESLTAEVTVMPTAALARIELSISRWWDIRSVETARLTDVWRPRELE